MSLLAKNGGVRRFVTRSSERSAEVRKGRVVCSEYFRPVFIYQRLFGRAPQVPDHTFPPRRVPVCLSNARFVTQARPEREMFRSFYFTFAHITDVFCSGLLKILLRKVDSASWIPNETTPHMARRTNGNATKTNYIKDTSGSDGRLVKSRVVRLSI